MGLSSETCIVWRQGREIKEMSEFIPKKVRIESNLKLFSLEGGKSTGSSIEVEYDVPEGISKDDFTRLVMKHKEKLDYDLLIMEMARGSLSTGDHNRLKGAEKELYQKIHEKIGGVNESKSED